MTPDEVTGAANLLRKRKALVHANLHTGPDDTYYLRTHHKTTSGENLCHLEGEEVQLLTTALIEHIDALLASMGVDISGLP